MKPNEQKEGEQREPIGSIKKRWRPLYSVLFTLQVLLGISFIIWREVALVINDTPVDTISAILLGIVIVGGASAITTGVIPEALDIMLGVRDFINEYLEERRKRAESEGLAEGLAKGLAEGRAERDEVWRTWYNRWKAAQERDEPFDEPPPDPPQA